MRGTRDRTFERQLRRRMTDAESRIWLHLRARRLCGHKFRRQQRIGRFVVDFMCIESRLIVELDGSQHIDRIEYDDERTAFLNLQGFKVIRFWDNDVLLRTDEVLAAILAALEDSVP